MNTISKDRPVIYFDGVCNLCNRAVQFVIKNDKNKIFLFAPLQSEPGKEAINQLKRNGNVPDSIILRYNDNYYTQSTAVLYILKLLGGLWALLYGGIFIPRFIRDGLYDLVSRKRYKWFGKQNECMIPTAEIMNRFLSK